MDPIPLIIENFDELKNTKHEAMLFPADMDDKSRGTQFYNLTRNVFIEKDDFSPEHSSKFFGLTPQQPVRLKYSYVVEFVKAEHNEDGSVNHIVVKALPDYDKPMKGNIHWVSEQNSVKATCNLYAVHFTVEAPKDDWLNKVNPQSLVVKENARVWNMHKKSKVDDRF